MNELSVLELTNINGGGIAAKVFGIIGLAIVFSISAVYEYFNQKSSKLKE